MFSCLGTQIKTTHMSHLTHFHMCGSLTLDLKMFIWLMTHIPWFFLSETSSSSIKRGSKVSFGIWLGYLHFKRNSAFSLELHLNPSHKIISCTNTQSLHIRVALFYGFTLSCGYTLSFISFIDQAFGFKLDSSFNCLTRESDWSFESRLYMHIINHYHIIDHVDLSATR